MDKVELFAKAKSELFTCSEKGVVPTSTDEWDSVIIMSTYIDSADIPSIISSPSIVPLETGCTLETVVRNAGTEWENVYKDIPLTFVTEHDPSKNFMTATRISLYFEEPIHSKAINISFSTPMQSVVSSTSSSMKDISKPAFIPSRLMVVGRGQKEVKISYVTVDCRGGFQRIYVEIPALREVEIALLFDSKEEAEFNLSEYDNTFLFHHISIDRMTAQELENRRIEERLKHLTEVESQSKVEKERFISIDEALAFEGSDYERIEFLEEVLFKYDKKLKCCQQKVEGLKEQIKDLNQRFEQKQKMQFKRECDDQEEQDALEFEKGKLRKKRATSK
ncbi:hypothetical protein ADUPG1_007271 [Aduncisulcus paluster]|uniref:Uncharacterized protein n=1 Tax=Aduncisulcus paluster TaxID=2918883 RepID=A0ABQ5KLD7_9EUKA|nr:hypothetical protein ADUPG1_007271 [Aduncisulcus paluster]